MKLLKYNLLDMCTGSYTDVGTTLAPKGTRCESPCIHKADRWGASFCYTNLTDKTNGWGAECVPCSGIRYIFNQFIVTNQTDK